MSNFGVMKLRLVQPFEPSFREARSGVGASQLLETAEVFGSVPDAIADCSFAVGTSAVRDREVHLSLELLPKAANMVRQKLGKQNVAVLFGSEKTGLSAEELSYCNLLLKIPSREEHLSLNLAQAVAVTVYEIVREQTIPEGGQVEVSRANSAAFDRITSVLFEALSESGYVKGESEATTEQKVRRLLRRLHLNDEDAETWLGMLRKMLWKLKQK